MLKNLKRSSVLIFVVIILLFASLNAQYQKEIKKDAPPLTEHYVRMSGFESLYTFQGYTSVVLNVDTVDGIYQRLNPSSYESNLNSIENGSIVLRYRFTSLTSAYYHILYQ